MKFLHIKKNKHNNEYITIDSNSRTMDALYWFLIFNMHMINCLDSFKVWANSNPKPEESIHNEFAGAYMQGDMITLFADLNDNQDDVEFTIKKSTFIQLLNDWKEIYLKLPKEVTIYFDGEQFTFDPVY